jgi:hypothetical protein
VLVIINDIYINFLFIFSPKFQLLSFFKFNDSKLVSNHLFMSTNTFIQINFKIFRVSISYYCASVINI